ncbi:MAG: VWA domain-containing protein [Bacteroidota bacterium]
MTFAYPHFFYLLLLIPLMLFWHWKINRRRKTQIRISDTSVFKEKKTTFKERIHAVPIGLRIITTALIIVALARPQSSSRGQNITSEGISIVLAMDLSSSMLAEDLKPNRIEAAKKVAMDFIESRPTDLIGLVVFSGESFTQCPITSDHSVLKNLMGELKSGMLEDGTAIGEGLATAILRLKDSKAKSKVIILLTDGVSNAGSIAPVTAGEIAKTFGIRVYTIGVGRNGTAPYPIKTPFGTQYQNMEVQIDEPVMRQISETTDGKYFRATDNKSLKQIYGEIDKMEKTKIEVTEFKRHSEEYLPWVLAAGLCLLMEVLLRYTYLKSLP